MIQSFSLREFGSYLVDFERTMAGLEIILRPPTAPGAVRSFFQQSRDNFKRTLEGLVASCVKGDVRLSLAVRMQMADFLTRLSARDLDEGTALVEHARLTRQAILNDLSEHLFLYMPTEVAVFYLKPFNGWETVNDRFGCAFDVEEARKCIALGRYTAAVFHLMKVLEKAVLELQMFLKEPDVKAHFGSVVDKLEKLTQRTTYDEVKPELQSYLPFLRDVLTQLHSVKDSWRNKVSHVDTHLVPTDTFTDELAIGVHEATLLLMKKLASGLPPKSGATAS